MWQVTLNPAYTINHKGGCIDDDLLEWIDKIITPAYPNVAAEWEYDEDGEVDADGLRPILAGPVVIKTDYGPSRLVASEAGLRKRKKYYDTGYLPFGGVPNGTAATQELDDLYGGLKAGGRGQANAIIAERTAAAGEARKAGHKPLPVNLTNADLPRIVNGCDTDAPEQRPFSWTFARERVARTLDKLGYIDSAGWVTRAAIHHPKVLAGAGCATETTGASTRRSERALQQVELHASNLARAAAAGLVCNVLEVVPKKPLKRARTPVDVAPMTESERAFKKIKESGASASTVFMYANGSSMWAPEVLDAALEGVLEKQAKTADVAASKDDDFNKLQQSAKALVEGAVSFDLLSKSDLTVVVRYLFSATGTAGVTKAVKERGVMLHNINLFTHAQLAELLERPPRTTKTEIAGLPKLKVPAEGALVEYASFASTFGSVECDLEQKTPVSAPVWLSSALEFQNPEGDKLLEFDILYRFEDGEGGWAVGTIDEINTIERRKVTVESDDGLSGKLPANVVVHYRDEDVILQRLSLDNYATSAASEVGSWALLASSGPSMRAKRPTARALEAPQSTPRLQLMPPTSMDVTLLSPEQRSALKAQLAALD